MTDTKYNSETDNKILTKINNQMLNSQNEPFGATLKDISGNDALISVFGDLITAKRIAQVSAQFMYQLREREVITESVGTGSSSISGGELTISTGVDVDGYKSIRSKKNVKYVPGNGVFDFFTAIFSTPKQGSEQFIGICDDNSGFAVGYKDLDFCFLRLRDGVAEYNVIDLSERGFIGFDPTKINVYSIMYGYLGAAPPTLILMKPQGGFEVLYEIEYPNSSTDSHIDQAYLPVRGWVKNIGNNTDITLSTFSISAGIIDGSQSYPLERPYSIDLTKTISAGSNIVGVFRNVTTYNTLANKIRATLTYLSYSTDGGRAVKFRLIKNPTILIEGTWANASANYGDSIIEVSEDTTVDLNTGELMFPVALTGSDSRVLMFDKNAKLNNFLDVGDIAVLDCVTTIQDNDITAGFGWVEEF